MSPLQMINSFNQKNTARRLRSAVAVLLSGAFSLGLVYSAFADITNDAKAIGEYKGQSVESEISSKSVPVATPAPAMTVTKTGQYLDDDGVAGLSAGDSISYTISVLNSGNLSLTGMTLSDALVQDGVSTTLTPALVATSDANSDGKINPGETFEYKASYEITQTNIDNGSDIVNTVSVTTDLLTQQDASDTYTFDASTLVSSYTMEKIASLADTDTDALGDLSETINYTFTFVNTGNATLTNLKAIDALPNLTAVTCSSDGDSDGDIDSLAPTATADCSASLVISSTNVAEGKVDNVATSTATKADGVTAVVEDDSADDNATSTPTETTYQLEVNAESTINDNDGVAGTSVGDTITYTVTVNNQGTGNAEGITIDDPLVTYTLQSGDTNGDGIMGPGETWIYTAEHTLTAADFAENSNGDKVLESTVTVDSGSTEPVTSATSVNLESNGAFTVATTGTLNDDDGVTGVSAGDTIDYVISIENTASDDLTNVSITDSLAQGTNSQALTPVLVSSSDTNGDGILNAGETWLYNISYTLSNDNINDGSALTYAAAVSTFELDDQSDEYEQALTGIIDSYDLVVTNTLVDGDGDGKGDVGENVDFTFTFTNTGSRDLTDLTATSSLAGMSNLVCTPDVDGDGKLDALAVGQTATCTASYELTQTDLDAGELENTVTASAETASGASIAPGEVSGNGSGSVALSLDVLVSLEIEKTLTKMETPFSNIYELEYTLNLENIGSVTLTNLSLIDNIKDAIDAPAYIEGDVEVINVSDDISLSNINSAYDGKTQTQVLASGFNLGAGEKASVTLSVRVNRLADDLKISNQAVANADQIDDAVHSDDPTVTPTNSSDVNPTVLAMLDTDNDGVTDDLENTSGNTDNDGDGVPNFKDYDPTGYLYCQEDGRILKLSGEKIRIENVTHGGSQVGVGSSNSINILHDGTSGYFQFLVSRAGRYRMVIPTPAGVKESSDRLSLGVMDVNSFLPTNPVILGSAVDGASESLQNFTAANNPYYLEFDIAEDAPNVLNNNIPYQNCGVPSFEPSASIVGTPAVQSDGSTQVTYRLEAINNGTVSLNDIVFEDNLASVFGADYEINSVKIDRAPIGFGAAIDASFDGESNTSLLMSGGTLKVDESVVVLLDVMITAPPGEYINVVQVNATNSIDDTPVGEEAIEVPLTITITGELDEVVALKTTPVVAAPLGSVVPYTITINNDSEFDITDAEVVDFVPQGFSYVKNSAKINGTPTEPEQSNARELVWPKQDLAAGDSITATLSLVMGANASGTEFINSAFLRSSITGENITNVAKVSIELEVESVFQCSQIIGRVFDDLDKDGYYDKGEPGIAGARVVSVNGLLITTDQFGRYHVACDQIPADRIGSNYILKLDERTLPTGYKVTSENPRIVRATRGKLVKLNFAAANLRVVSVELKDSSFKKGSTSLNRDAILDIARILPILEEEKSILKINYVTASDVSREHNKKLKAVKDLVLKAWRARKRSYRLKVDTKVRGN